MKKWICDICGIESNKEEDIEEYRMFVCNNYEGDEVEICHKCGLEIRNKWRKNNEAP